MTANDVSSCGNVLNKLRPRIAGPSLQTSALPLGYGAGRLKLAPARKQLQDVGVALREVAWALPGVVLNLGIGAVRKQIARQLHVLLMRGLVQRGPALLLLPVDRRARFDDQPDRLERPPGHGRVEGLNAHGVLR